MVDYEINLRTSLNDPEPEEEPKEEKAEPAQEIGESPAEEPEEEEPVPDTEPRKEQAPEPAEGIGESPAEPAEEEPEEKPRKERKPSDIVSAAKGMVSFFTMLPVDAEEKDIDAMNEKFWMTPLIIGAIYGLIAVVSFFMLNLLFGFALGMLLTMVVLLVLNRMLHMDGLMDTADGLMVAGTQEDHVRALRDVHVGTGGIVAAVMVIIATLFAYWSGGLQTAYVMLFAGEVLAKTAQVAAAAVGEPGSGMAGESVRNTSTDQFLLSYIISIAICAIWAVCICLIFAYGQDRAWMNFDTYNALACLLAAVTAPLWGVLMAKLANKNFGYVNGDVLGASNETGRLAALLLIVMFLGLMLRF